MKKLTGSLYWWVEQCVPTIYVSGQKKFESYLSDRLNFSNIHGRTSRRIYRLTLPLRAPEMPDLKKYNAHLTLFVWMEDTITRTNA